MFELAERPHPLYADVGPGLNLINSLRSLTKASPEFHKGEKFHDFNAIFDPNRLCVVVILNYAVNRKKHQNVFSYLLQNPTDSDKIWYTLS